MPRAESMRKKMRKGTHSCFECRRRKIRCIFPPESPNICSECFARGSKCIDQEHADADVVVDQRKNLRERVSRLEALVESLVTDRSDSGAAEVLNILRKESLFPPTPLSSDAASSGRPVPEDATAAPSLFGNDWVTRIDHEAGSSTSSDDERDEGMPTCSFVTAIGNLELSCKKGGGADNLKPTASKSATKLKYDQTRKALFDLLPVQDMLNKANPRSAEWWDIWREKLPGTCGTGETLGDFCKRALQEDSAIGAIGTAVLAIRLTLDADKIDAYLTAVERLVTQDDEYAATLEGLECLLLATKCYADIGQPRKAWILFRRGSTLAQMIGLHRNHALSAAHESIWWSLWIGDRCISLLLGLPYSIVDAHCNLETMVKDEPSLSFIIALGRVAAKVIDRTQGSLGQSYASALEIDHELEMEISKVPADWWDVSWSVKDSNLGAGVLREKLMAQLFIHQIRLILHLPFMLQAKGNQRLDYSKNMCLKAAREMLRVYHMMRTGSTEPLSDCKAIDYLGFTAAIVLALGVLGAGQPATLGDAQEAEGDWRLIEISMDIFRRASSEKGGLVAAQSYAVLDQLNKLRNLDLTTVTAETLGAKSKLVIPYFGTITIRNTDRSPSSSSTEAVKTPSSTTTASVSPPMPVHNDFASAPASFLPKGAPMFNDPVVAYDGFYMPHNDFPQPQLGNDNLLNFSVPQHASLSWQNAATMDIDQDWAWFLNDSQQQQQQQYTHTF